MPFKLRLPIHKLPRQGYSVNCFRIYNLYIICYRVNTFKILIEHVLRGNSKCVIGDKAISLEYFVTIFLVLNLN